MATQISPKHPSIKPLQATAGLVLLACLWVFLSARLIVAEGLFTFKHPDTDAIVVDGVSSGDSGQVITGEIISMYPNFSSLGVRFLSFGTGPENNFTFKIRSKDSDSWFFTTNHRTEEIVIGKLYDFSFPLQDDSVNKSYVFELAFENHGVLIEEKTPVISATSVFTHKELTGNFEKLLYFSRLKLISIVSDDDLRGAVINYSIPFLIFLFFCLLGGGGFLLPMLALFFVVADIFLIGNHDDFILLSIIFAWSLPIYRLGVDPSVSATVTLANLLIVLIAMLLSLDMIAENAAVWSFFFGSFTLAQIAVYSRLNKKVHISSKTFWKKIPSTLSDFIRYIFMLASREITIDAKKIPPQTGKKTNDGVRLTSYRFGKPLNSTYVLTTRLISSLIVLIVRFIQFGIVYGPASLLVTLVWITTRNIYSYYLFYKDFIGDNFNKIFWDQLGIKLFIVQIATLIIFLLFQRRKSLRSKIYIGLFIVFLLSKANIFIFDRATPYKDDVIIQFVRPSELKEPWADVTINGRNFGARSFPGLVIIDGVKHRIMSWSEREIVFRTNPTETKTGKIKVITSSGKQSNEHEFKYSGNR